MTENHPITPSPKLVKQWVREFEPSAKYPPIFDNLAATVATQAARWGADQELEACCADLRMVLGPDQADWLRSVRRPKPPSLKEQALAELQALCDTNDTNFSNLATIRRALEALPE